MNVFVQYNQIQSTDNLMYFSEFGICHLGHSNSCTSNSTIIIQGWAFYGTAVFTPMMQDYVFLILFPPQGEAETAATRKKGETKDTERRKAKIAR